MNVYNFPSFPDTQRQWVYCWSVVFRATGARLCDSHQHKPGMSRQVTPHSWQWGECVPRVHTLSLHIRFLTDLSTCTRSPSTTTSNSLHFPLLAVDLISSWSKTPKMEEWSLLAFHSQILWGFDRICKKTTLNGKLDSSVSLKKELHRLDLRKRHDLLHR